MTTKQRSTIQHICGAILLTVLPALALAAENPFVGNWALTIPGGGAGWLGVTSNQDQLEGSLLWGGGSVLPVASVRVDGDTLVVVRDTGNRRKAAAKKATIEETIRAKLDGDQMNLTLERTRPNGTTADKTTFSGKRIPPLPAAPDLSKVKFGEAITLFSGKDLSGWKIMNDRVPNGWSAVDGVLVNRAPQEPGKHISYANIATEREFEDFQLTLEVRVPEGGNSGIYLRGIYEVQVADTFGRELDSHNMGGIYSRITPTVAAEKPAGEWQTFNITLVDRHVTVALNGKTIIDNQPLLGCTGGALWADEFRPGPLYLQGDHTSAEYRNITIRPVVK
jgi:hypothetical protein